MQLSEVGSPIVSSTSSQEQESASQVNLTMVQLREAGGGAARQSDNIGSIITMLIDEQVGRVHT